MHITDLLSNRSVFGVKMKAKILAGTQVALVSLMVLACAENKNDQAKEPEQPTQVHTKQKQVKQNDLSDIQKGSFAYDDQFLSRSLKIIKLSSDDNRAQILVSPEYQGRVMTSTANGMEGQSFGWINYELIESGEFEQHINVFGGEDRFWIGPEGGQYSIFFKPGTAFEFENWFTPAEIDTQPFEVVSVSQNTAAFKKRLQLTNYSGFQFDFDVNRTVRLLNSEQMSKEMGFKLSPAVLSVAYESENTMINRGSQPWTKESGLLSVWILGMFNPSAQTTIVIPYQQGDNSQLGKVVTDDYFGKVAQQRLKLSGGVIYFKGDGKQRGKIGVSPSRVMPFSGSYDALNQVLTIIQYSVHEGVSDYVNSQWKHQKHPYQGDVVNAYNDGPLASGDQLGPFYELESSSPAAALKPGEKITHYHRTFHFTGDLNALNDIASRTLGVNLKQIEAALPN
jgi:Family of unknown function (DUF6786)